MASRRRCNHRRNPGYSVRGCLFLRVGIRLVGGATIGPTRARVKAFDADLPQNVSGAAPTLTDTKRRNAKPRSKIQRSYDTGGLSVEIAPRGGKWWRFKYRFEGMDIRLSLGSWQARENEMKPVSFSLRDLLLTIARREAKASTGMLKAEGARQGQQKY